MCQTSGRPTETFEKRKGNSIFHDSYKITEKIIGEIINSTPNDENNVRIMNEKFTTAYSSYVEAHTATCDCKTNYVELSNVMDALNSMKGGKSADSDEISAEHLIYAPLNVLIRISGLFNSMLKHGCVPQQFRYGYMVPIIKDHQGSSADINNYRGITISPIISKLFEHVLKIIFSEFLTTSENQFGFKKSSSTVNALHCLRETIDYYVNNGSRVFCAFLDTSKAFDRLVHSGLFIKLMQRNVPLAFLNIIINWYDGLMCQVKWGDHLSHWFCITAGVRQGGVLSPDFYCIYVDDLLKELKCLNKGCYVMQIFAAAFFYADDMAVIAPSVKALSLLLQACERYCTEWDICLNAKKSRCMYFGRRIEILHDIVLNNKVVEWAKEWLYLGVKLRSGKSFDCSIMDRVKKFYRCVNAISRIEGHSNDMVMLRLMESHCIPLLTYAIEVVKVNNADERRQLRVAYNAVFRKIFRYRWSQSVTALQNFLGKPTWEQLIEKRRSAFVNRINSASSNSLAFNLLH